MCVCVYVCMYVCVCVSVCVCVCLYELNNILMLCIYGFGQVKNRCKDLFLLLLV